MCQECTAEKNSRCTKKKPDAEKVNITAPPGIPPGVNAAHRQSIHPIDVCFELVGLIRTHWRGLSGGDVVWKETGAFFERLKSLAVPMRGNIYA